MRTWTSTLSPISKRGMSFLAAAPSTRAINRFFMVITFLLRGARRAPAAGQGLFVPPAGDGLVIAAEQDLRDGHAAEDAGAGVLRVLQPAGVVVRFLRQALGVAEHARHVADY